MGRLYKLIVALTAFMFAAGMFSGAYAKESAFRSQAQCKAPDGRVIEGLTQEQCRAIEEELAVSGGQFTAETVESLKKNPALSSLRPEEILSIKEQLERSGARRKEGAKTEGKREEKPREETSREYEEVKTLFDRYVSEDPSEEAFEKLKPFGYEIFKTANKDSSQNLPVASDYVIGPGDEVTVFFWGSVRGQHSLVVSRDGTLLFPNVGPLAVAGMTFEEMKKLLARQVKNIVGAEVSVTMGNLKGIQVFVLGEVNKPGPYTVSANSTVTSAVTAAGGPTGIGTLRKVELKRGSATVSTLDFYDILLNGDKSKDLSLRNGDVIFVPTVGPLVGVRGGVKRPGIYELKDSSDILGVLATAGGIIPTAYTERIQVERVQDNVKRTVVDITNLNGEGTKAFLLQDGDLVKVYTVVDRDVNAVYLYGNVKRPGKYELKDGMRLKDIIRSEDDLLKDTYFKYGLIKRVVPPGQEVRLMTVNMENFLFKGSQEDNIELRPRDSIYVFSKWSFKEKPSVTIEGEVRCVSDFQERSGIRDICNAKNLSIAQCSLLEKELAKAGGLLTAELAESLQKRAEFKGMAFDDLSRRGKTARDAEDGKEKAKDAVAQSVGGRCTFELQENMTVKDLVLIAGGVRKDASFGEFEIYRTDQVSKTSTLYKLDLGKALDGTASDNMKLQDMDRVVIHSVWEQMPKQTVTVIGAVNNPGDYAYAANMRVNDLVFAAGSLHESAYMDEAELASSIIKEGTSFYVNYQKIDLRKAMSGDPAHNALLKPRDTLQVKKIPDWEAGVHVKIDGEVVFPGKYLIKKGERLSSLIKRAGGFTDKAYLKGTVFTRESVRLLQQKSLDEAVAMLEQRMLTKTALNMEASVTAEDSKLLQAASEQRKALLAKMKTARASGRISIRLSVLERFKGSTYDMTLEDGDAILIPDTPSQVQVVGAVYNQNAFIYDPKATISSYLKKTGGLKKDADESEMYILKVDGTAVSKREGAGAWLSWDSENNGWIGGFMSARLEPGDTIVVPEKIEKIAWLKEVKDLTQILYQIAVTAGVLIVAF